MKGFPKVLFHGMIFLMLGTVVTHAQKVAEFRMNWKLDQIHVRDPFILADSLDHSYYLYVQKGNNANRSFTDKGVEVYRSKDLKIWDGPYSVLDITADSWADDKVWAPEVHQWNGKYYLFVTLTSSDTVVLRRDQMPLVHRATQIFSAEGPRGPFEPLNERPILGIEKMTLDGTLFVDEQHDPWMIYCHEWVQIRDGAIEAVRLSNDLSEKVSNPETLFHASDAPWVKNISENGSRYDGFVTDGPFLFRSKSGKLIIIWSSMGESGYSIGQAISESDKITGPWKQMKKPLFASNGGHGMIFKGFEGNYYLTLHSPNGNDMERTHLYVLYDKGDRLELGKDVRP